MNLLIMGLPGSGKGTQSELIVDKYHVKHLSTGNLFRQEMKSDSALGRELASFINKGELVPDQLTIRLLEQELKKPLYQNGFLLDGYPRTLNQAQVLDEMLTSINEQIDAVIYLDLDQDVIIKRLSGRLFCPKCQKTYHQTLNPPQVENVCDDDQEVLMQREDDKPEKVANRLQVSLREMDDLINFYQQQGKLKNIKILETDSIDQVFEKIEHALND